MTGARRWLVALVAFVFAGVVGEACRHRRAGVPRIDPDMVIEEVRSRSLPFALQARYAVDVTGPGFSGSTTGAMVLHPPKRFRIEVHSPLSTPLIYLASNGRAVNAFSFPKGIFYRGDDATAVLDQITRGAVDGADVIALLTGVLPMPDAEVLLLESVGMSTTQVDLQGAQGVQLRAALDSNTGMMRWLRVVQDAAHAPAGVEVELVSVNYGEYLKVGRTRLPEALQIELPTIGWKIGLEFFSWDEMGKIPEVFDLAPPAGATEADLIETLRTMAEKQSGKSVVLPGEDSPGGDTIDLAPDGNGQAVDGG